MSLTFDRNASAAVLALRRLNRSQAEESHTWVTNLVEVISPGSLQVALTAAGLATFSGVSGFDLTGADYGTGQFVISGNVAYVIDRIKTATTADVHRVGRGCFRGVYAGCYLYSCHCCCSGCMFYRHSWRYHRDGFQGEPDRRGFNLGRGYGRQRRAVPSECRCGEVLGSLRLRRTR